MYIAKSIGFRGRRGSCGAGTGTYVVQALCWLLSHGREESMKGAPEGQPGSVGGGAPHIALTTLGG